MNALQSIRVQKLFLVAVILKVVSAFFGWLLQLQWILGLALPLVVMAVYIAVGLKRQDRDVTDEKFADSCYYLGFIFTITSIVFSLFDLPQIGERIQDIAVRFGAAMVSTVFGLVVRVYLVSFRPDATDALKNAEDAVLEAAQKFREHLIMAYEKLGDFQSQVTSATQTSVEAVKLQVEKMAQDHSARMEQVFKELNERNQQAVTEGLAEVSAASSRLAQSVDDYADGMKGSLQSLGDKVDTFGDAVTQRLQTTTFPDDYFARRLAEPLEQLKVASTRVSEQVQAAATGASEATTVLAAAIRKLKSKTTQAEESLDTVVRLTTAQHSLFDTAASQVEQLNKLAELLAEIRAALQASTAAAAANASSNAEVQDQVKAIAAAVRSSQGAVVEALDRVAAGLQAEKTATSSLGAQVHGAEAATKALTQEMRNNSIAAQQLSATINAEASTRPQLVAAVDAVQVQQTLISKALHSLDAKASGVSSEVGAAFAQLRGVSERLEALLVRMTPRPAPAPVTAATGTTGAASAMPVPGSLAGTAPAFSPPVTAPTPAMPGGVTPSVSYFPGPPTSSPGSGQGGTGIQG